MWLRSAANRGGALSGRHYSAFVQQRAINVNGIEFSYLESGPPEGPLALCLHGFPDSAHTWRHLLPALAEAGYHAVAPWMRGYAPTEVSADDVYQVGALAADASALHETLGGDGRAVRWAWSIKQRPGANNVCRPVRHAVSAATTLSITLPAVRAVTASTMVSPGLYSALSSAVSRRSGVSAVESA